MNIVNIIQCSNFGGMEWATLRLMREFKRDGHATHIHSLTKPGGIENVIKKDNIKFSHSSYTRFFDPFNFISSYIDVRRLVHKYDYCFFTGLSLISILAAKSSNRARNVLAVHFHHENVKSRATFYFLYTLAGFKFSLITFPSLYVYNEAIAICPRIKKYSKILPNILPTFNYSYIKDKSKKTLILGNAGWLIKRKRFDIFLRVIHELKKNNINVIGYIAGDGAEKESLERLSLELGVNKQIKWLGNISDIETFYRKIDILLFSTDFDALPTTPIEALSCNIPVVCSSLNGGASEYIVNGKNGYIIKQHNIKLLAKLCLKVYEKKPLSNVKASILKKYQTHKIKQVYYAYLK